MSALPPLNSFCMVLGKWVVLEKKKCNEKKKDMKNVLVKRKEKMIRRTCV